MRYVLYVLGVLGGSVLLAMVCRAAEPVLHIQFVGELDVREGTMVVEVDAFEVTKEVVAEQKAAGREVLCYVNVGAWEKWRSDAGQFPRSVRGRAYAGWEGERFLDIRAERVRVLMAARFALAKEKGCDGIDPDNMDSFVQKTGFRITQRDAVRYALFLADTAHGLGMTIYQKNAPDLVGELVGHFDGAVVESCVLYGWCAVLAPYAEGGKRVFDIEYPELGVDRAAACRTEEEMGVLVVFKRRALDAWGEGCG